MRAINNSHGSSGHLVGPVNYERMFAAIECPTLAYWEGKVLSTHNRQPGAEVNVTCAHAYRFAAGTAEQYMVTCSDRGHWTPVIPDCTSTLRKYNHVNVQHKLVFVGDCLEYIELRFFKCMTMYWYDKSP